MIDVYKNEWQRNDGTITISKDFFEHLLNCLCNQKYIGELPTNGDSISVGKQHYDSVQEEGQSAIDKAWNQGMFIMGLDFARDNQYKKMIESYVSFWNESIPEIMKNRDQDKLDFPQDDNICFKWQHLVDQEIWMWIKLGCHSQAIIDVENEKYEIGQVDAKDFDEIVKRRGFTPRMISFLIKILKHVGIGDNLIEKTT